MLEWRVIYTKAINLSARHDNRARLYLSSVSAAPFTHHPQLQYYLDRLVPANLTNCDEKVNQRYFADEMLRLPMLVFPETRGVPPIVCSEDPDEELMVIPEKETQQRASLLTSGIFLAIAKMLQEGSSDAANASRASGIMTGSPSLVLMSYYLALAFSPSASLYNNVGVVLSGLTSINGWVPKLIDTCEARRSIAHQRNINVLALASPLTSGSKWLRTPSEAPPSRGS